MREQTIESMLGIKGIQSIWQCQFINQAVMSLEIQTMAKRPIWKLKDEGKYIYLDYEGLKGCIEHEDFWLWKAGCPLELATGSWEWSGNISWQLYIVASKVQ